MERLRGPVEEKLTTATDDFQRRLDARLAAAEERIGKRSASLEQQAVATVEGAMERLRGPMEEKLTTATEDFQHRLDAKLVAAEERIGKHSAALEQQAGVAVEGAVERLRGPLEEKLAAASEDLQQRLDAKVFAAEERINKRTAALEQQAVTAVEGALERLRGPVEENLASATEDFQHRLDTKLAAVEERIDKRTAALEQQAVTAIDGTVERLQVSVGELLGSAFEDFQPQLDANLAAAEEQATATVEGAMERLRGPLEEKLAGASEDFQRRLEAKLAAAEERMSKRSDESFAQLEDALTTFRHDLEDELNARKEEAVASTEQVLRARIPSLIASIFAPPGAAPPSSNPELKK